MNINKDQYYRDFRNSITFNLHDIDLASDYFFLLNSAIY